MTKERNITLKVITTDELPEEIRGCCARFDRSDNYAMLINGNNDERAQLRSFLHECLHIWRCDYDSERDADEVEKERHEEVEELLAMI